MTEQEYISSLEKRIECLEKENSSLWDIIDNIWTLDIKQYADVLMNVHTPAIMDKLVHRICG